MNKIILYANGSSSNHGCEAINISTFEILKNIKMKIIYSTTNIKDEYIYNDLNRTNLYIEYSLQKKINIISKCINYCYRKMTKKNLNYGKYNYFQYEKVMQNADLALSVGGDNYSYNASEWLYVIHDIAIKKGCFTVLWGCSIEPSYIDKDMIEDLKKFDLIICRESITFNAISNLNIMDNVKIYPDPAFVLGKTELPLPSLSNGGGIIGINTSPLVEKLGCNKSITYSNYRALIKYILDDSNINVALIPHVVGKGNNDLIPLTRLYHEFKETDRVILIEDHNCMELKGFISRCRFFVGARTHATIAAYSSCVPTLAVGYSVKARGIARDIFGSEENMVIPVQSLKHEDDLVNAFKYIQSNEDSIRKHLQDFMPSYIEKAWQVGEEVRKLIEK